LALPFVGINVLGVWSSKQNNLQKVDTIRIKSQQMKTEHLFQNDYLREI
jgi:hypothetical protein